MMGEAQDKLDTAEEALADLHASQRELKAERSRIAELVLLGKASPEDFGAVFRSHMMNSGLISEANPIIERLRQEAQREAESEKRDRMFRQDEAIAAIRKEIWQHPDNAARIFKEAIETTQEYKIRLAHNQNVRPLVFDDDVARFLVPEGLISRGTGPRSPDWVVLDLTTFVRWVADSALAFMSNDGETRRRIEVAKRNRGLAQSRPQQIIVQQRGY